MATTTVLHTSLLPFPVPAVHYFCESWITCYSGPSSAHTYRARTDSLAATGHALSILPAKIQKALDPAKIQKALDIVIQPVPGWKGLVPTWFGVPCRIGRVTLWLPVQEPTALYREFSLLVLLPKHDLPDASPLIHLGTQFLLEYQGRLVLDTASSSGQRLLVIP